ncbi:BTB/POZ domain containing protein [Aphelenchoides avenae]|nr:BTB/POZ domain containing protein [Aphelenchus avenae]
MMQAQKWNDITFIVGPEEHQELIYANSYILSAASDVFDAMFFGANERQDTVEVPDGTAEGFRELVKYAYTDEVELSLHNVSSVIYLSKKYLMTELYDAAAEYVKQHLSFDTALDFLARFELFDDIYQSCLEYVCNHGENILKSTGFVNIDHKHLLQILARDDLNAYETTIYKRTIAWAKSQLAREKKPGNSEDIRRVLWRAIYKIRFPTMTMQEFARGPAQGGVLTPQECLEIYNYLVLRQPNPMIWFSSKRRICRHTAIWCAECRRCLRRTNPASDASCTHSTVTCKECHAALNKSDL